MEYVGVPYTYLDWRVGLHGRWLPRYIISLYTKDAAGGEQRTILVLPEEMGQGIRPGVPTESEHSYLGGTDEVQEKTYEEDEIGRAGTQSKVQVGERRRSLRLGTRAVGGVD
jgi:hypothetical protein